MSAPLLRELKIRAKSVFCQWLVYSSRAVPIINNAAHSF
jgi:hypothetical protein